LHPLRTTNIAGDSEIIGLVKETAQLDPEKLYIHIVYNWILGAFPAKSTVYTPFT
jgi:hypothetical protein